MAFPIDKAWLVDRYLTKLDLTGDNGDEYPDAFYTNAIDAALENAKARFDLPITTKTVTERLDYNARDWEAWQFLHLSKVPVRSVTAVKYKYGTSAMLDIPTDWYFLESEMSGQLQMIPNLSSFGTPFIPIMGGMPIWAGPWTPGGMRQLPGWFEVIYEAGWADEDIPADILHAISLWAGIEVLNTAGDLIAGAGVASFSIGVDGIHNSLNTTSSATNSGYGARIIQWEKQLKEMEPIIRARYRGSSQWDFA